MKSRVWPGKTRLRKMLALASTAVVAQTDWTSNCTEARNWDTGGRYRTTLHAIIGGLSFGTQGFIASAASEKGAGYNSQFLMDNGFAQGSAAYQLLMLAATTTIGSAAAGAPGAAVSFNITANNLLQHHSDFIAIQL
jgi:hypothetical protein